MCKNRKIMVKPFVHIEQGTDDPEKTKDFCGSLSGWTLEMVFMRRCELE
jgi:hypothetical protein